MFVQLIHTLYISPTVEVICKHTLSANNLFWDIYHPGVSLDGEAGWRFFIQPNLEFTRGGMLWHFHLQSWHTAPVHIQSTDDKARIFHNQQEIVKSTLINVLCSCYEAFFRCYEYVLLTWYELFTWDTWQTLLWGLIVVSPGLGCVIKDLL